jgi:hypothetical protein
VFTPEEERDLIIAEKPVIAQKGQDHIQYLDYLKVEYDSLKYGLNDLQLTLFQKLMLSHVMMAKQEVEEKQQAMMEQMQAAQGQEQGGGINKGGTPNTTAFNQGSAPSTESMRKDVGG